MMLPGSRVHFDWPVSQTDLSKIGADGYAEHALRSEAGVRARCCEPVPKARSMHSTAIPLPQQGESYASSGHMRRFDPLAITSGLPP
jgi:hypothetical protein